tara:strand:+ start:3931 stop:4218 length:288 start_codon:yes stop_codon:yes gene_type:complete
MSWREAVRRHFPELSPDDITRANVPSVPGRAAPAGIGTPGTLARLEACEQYDAHVSDWMEWEERAAIMEYDGGLTRAEAESAAAKVIRLDERRLR